MNIHFTKGYNDAVKGRDPHIPATYADRLEYLRGRAQGNGSRATPANS